jgi:hypothetical protein
MVCGALSKTRKFKINNSINTKLSYVSQSSCSDVFSQLNKEIRDLIISILNNINYDIQGFNLVLYIPSYKNSKVSSTYHENIVLYEFEFQIQSTKVPFCLA